MRQSVFRLIKTSGDPVNGRVRWAPLKSIWINTCLLVFLFAAPFATTPGSITLFVVSRSQ